MEYLTPLFFPALVVLAAYLLGSVSFAVLVSRTLGLSDPRTYGSLNPGATNVLRSGSKAAAVLTLLLDALKGFAPVVCVHLFGQGFGLGSGTIALVAMAAFFGHLWPVFFQFKGGKGVATAAGIAFGIHWALGLAALAMFLIVIVTTRWVSLASVIAAAATPFIYLMGHGGAWYSSADVVTALLVMATALTLRHKQNISRLLAGTEPKLGARK